MKNIVISKCISCIILCSISLIIFFPNKIFSNEKYWVPKFPPKSNYEINAEINVADKIIKGEEIVTFTNSSHEDIKILTFNWSISEKSTIKISSNGELLSLLYTEENGTVSPPLIYSLKSPIKSGKEIQLKIEFSSSELIRNTDEILLDNWYPRLSWDGIDTFDSYKIKLDIPDEFVHAISGKLNKKTGFYENNGVRSCGIYLRKGLITKQKEIEDVLITSLFTKDGSECAKLCLSTAIDVVKFYKDWFGFYPFEFLYIIPGGAEPWGGYPFASGIVVIHGQEKFDTKPLLHWKWITAHEIGHQYWGEYVFDDFDSWLWIGLGVYADREYTIHRNLGLEKHTDMMNDYIEGVKNHYNTTADLTASQIRRIDFDYNNVIKHGKGFSIISALESVLGKDMFIQIYKRCLDEYAGKYLNYRDFWRMCEEESGENLAWFFEQWVRSDNYLSYSIVSQKSIQEKDKFISNIRIKCHGTLKMPIPVKAIFEDGSSQTKFTNRLLGINHLMFESKSKLKDYRSWFKLGMVLFDSRNDQEVLYSFQKANEIDPQDFITLVWLGHMNDLKGQREEALKYYKKALDNDDGVTYQHGQFDLFINKKWVEERLLTPFTLK